MTNHVSSANLLLFKNKKIKLKKTHEKVTWILEETLEETLINI